MRFCGLEIEGKLFELAGDKVLGELLIVLLPPPVKQCFDLGSSIEARDHYRSQFISQNGVTNSEGGAKW